MRQGTHNTVEEYDVHVLANYFQKWSIIGTREGHEAVQCIPAAGIPIYLV